MSVGTGRNKCSEVRAMRCEAKGEGIVPLVKDYFSHAAGTCAELVPAYYTNYLCAGLGKKIPIPIVVAGVADGWCLRRRKAKQYKEPACVPPAEPAGPDCETETCGRTLRYSHPGGLPIAIPVVEHSARSQNWRIVQRR